MGKNKEILTLLWEERTRLRNIAEKARHRLQTAPEGSVRVIKHKDGVQFYRRMDPKDRNGVYMPVSEKATAQALVQKKYDQQLMKAASKQICLIDTFLKKYDPDILEKIYWTTAKNRREYLTQAEIPDEVYRSNWEAQIYEAKPFSDEMPEHFTVKKERVRSKSEVMIANALYTAGIPYRYECPLWLGRNRVHPDFTILRMADRQEVYWEHLGLLDDTDYRNKAVLRVQDYEKEGILLGDRLIVTAETFRTPLNLSIIENTIQNYLA